MDTLQAIIKSFQKQNQAMQYANGLASLQGLGAMLAKQQKQQLQFGKMHYLTELAKSISRQTKSYAAASGLIDKNVLINIAAAQTVKSNFPFYALTNSLTELAKKNQTASNYLSAFASSQIIASNNLAQIGKALSQSHLSKFNSLDTALKGISKSFLNDITLNHNWDDILVAEKANETITEVTSQLVNDSKSITLNDLDELKQSIVSELFGLLGKTKKEKARQFLFELIALIGFLLTLYGTYVQTSDNSNREVIRETKKEIEKISREFSDKIELELNKLNKTRTSLRKASLYFSGNKNSKIIGTIKTGQQVTVIEVRHKYLLVSYLDKVAKEPKSGFVIKKYFEIDK